MVMLLAGSITERGLQGRSNPCPWLMASVKPEPIGPRRHCCRRNRGGAQLPFSTAAFGA
jgi:hypothetical protein